MTHGISRVLAAARSGRPAQEWLNARARIAEDREMALSVLHSQETVYGFSTFVGHLDSVASCAADQRRILDAHLVGVCMDASGAFLDLVSACKAEQLSQGGSGIREQTYEAILDSFTGESASGSWLASYSSADVVPAAWWATARVLPSLSELGAGDVICLINGSFFGGACAIVAAASAMYAISGALERLSPVAPLITLKDTVEVDVFRPFFADEKPVSVQLPVSLRDAAPAVLTLVRALRDSFDAIEGRLSRVSCNPLFADNGAHSQSSFLDFETTRSLRGLSLAVQLASGLVQRLITHQLDGSNPFGVQPPKIASAALLAGRTRSLPAFVGDDSRGVEDLRDLALLVASELYISVGVLRELCEIYDGSIGVPDERRSQAFVESLSRLVVPVVPPDLMSFAAQIALPHRPF